MDKPLAELEFDGERALLLVDRRGTVVVQVLSPDAGIRTVAELDAAPALLASDRDGRFALAQYNWSPLDGSRPDLERLLIAWDLDTMVELWRATLRFVAETVEIDGEADRVEMRSQRYGHTSLRLTDGYLVRDRGKTFARTPSYPGTLPGAFRPHPVRKGGFALWPLDRITRGDQRDKA